ncbi:MAG: hypothetical protein Q9M13_02395 [Mariprofundales bacterium]|nr:hypothetical protein [Mariprofundales bacterium]
MTDSPAAALSAHSSSCSTLYISLLNPVTPESVRQPYSSPLLRSKDRLLVEPAMTRTVMPESVRQPSAGS